MPAILLSLVLGIPSGALAYWTATGAGSGSGASGTLAPPTNVVATRVAQMSAATIAWSPSTTSGIDGYRVERAPTGTSTWTAVCGTSTIPVTASLCTDSGVADGTYQYRVTALRGTWTAIGSPMPTVTVDTVRPTVTITRASTQPASTNVLPIVFTATFSEAVTGFATGDTTLAGTAVTRGATAQVTAVSATEYTITVNGVTTTALAGGTVIPTVVDGAAQDGAGNGNAASTGPSVLYDPNPPAQPAAPDLTAATDSSAPSLAATTGHSDNITNSATRTFTQSVGTSVADDVENGTVRLYRSTSASVEGTLIDTKPVTGGAYTISDSSTPADGVYYYSVRYIDALGNVSQPGVRLPVTYDTVAPVPTMTYTNAILTVVPLLGSVTVSGTAPHTATDLLPVDIRICSGSNMSCSTAAATATVTANAATGAYTYTTSNLLGGLLVSTTAQVSQYDVAGNRGTSAPLTIKGLLG